MTEYSHAGIVRDTFKKVAAGFPLIRIEDELNVKGIPSPQGGDVAARDHPQAGDEPDLH
ncbi:hypothetical protein [Plantactinospora sp. DSM 117369]